MFVCAQTANAAATTGSSHEEGSAAAPATVEWRIGDKVERRDGNDSWGYGFVTEASTQMLKVTTSDSDPSAQGYSWDEVRLASGRVVKCWFGKPQL